MKSVLVVAVALFAVAFAYPKPADVVSADDESAEGEGDTEFVTVPLQRGSPRDDPAIGFGIGIPSFFGSLTPSTRFNQNPFFRGSPWGGFRPLGADDADEEHIDRFMLEMQETLRELSKHLNTLSHRDGAGEDDDSLVTRIGGAADLPKNQTTSTTKVIDGHIVTVNETTYSSGDDKIGAVFKIKVTEVIPSESPEESEPTEGPSSSEAPDAENDTTNIRSELEEDKHEETNEIPDLKARYAWSPEFDPSLNEIDQPDVGTVEHFTPTKEEIYHDLSGDTKVNDFASDQAQSQGLVMIDPDAELIDANSNSYYRYDMEPQGEQKSLV